MVAGDPEAFHQHPQPEQMGLLHGRDPVHGAVLRLEDDGCEVGRPGGGGHALQQPEADRVAVLQQREPRPARCHHQTPGCEKFATLVLSLRPCLFLHRV